MLQVLFELLLLRGFGHELPICETIEYFKFFRIFFHTVNLRSVSRSNASSSFSTFGFTTSDVNSRSQESSDASTSFPDIFWPHGFGHDLTIRRMIERFKLFCIIFGLHGLVDELLVNETIEYFKFFCIVCWLHDIGDELTAGETIERLFS